MARQLQEVESEVTQMTESATNRQTDYLVVHSTDIPQGRSLVPAVGTSGAFGVYLILSGQKRTPKMVQMPGERERERERKAMSDRAGG